MLAIRKFAPDLRILGGFVATVSLLTWFAYRQDKRRAQSRAWRIAESTLHVLELIGGWPAAFLAQRHFRHKCSKSSYQLLFWLIILAHQFLAFDYLQNWKFSSLPARWSKQPIARAVDEAR